jgi:DHA1 family bicyclomycin/chloramphenicol resistance-like MFS transporter
MTRFGEEQTAQVATAIGAGVTVALLVVTAGGLGGLIVLTLGVWALFATLGISTLVLTVIAMHPHGHAAGMASALIGTLTFGMGAASSALVSAFQDGTEMPMLVVMTSFAVAALVACQLALRISAAETTTH